MRFAQIFLAILLAVQAQSADDSSSNNTPFMKKLGRSLLDQLRRKRQSPAGPSGSIPGAQCARDCTNAAPRTCYYEWHVERYTTLGPACRNCSRGVQSDCWSPQCILANGHQRGILAINRQGHGPEINVCEGDTIVVKVINDMPDEATSIHWHGIRQKTSPWMDGVVGVTQCAIPPYTEFTYNFKASKAGTYFWHSHVGAQKLEVGMEGPLIIRSEKRRNVNGYLYDVDEPRSVVFIQDWTNLPANQYIPGIHNESFEQLPDAVLINGLGRYSFNSSNMRIPLANFTVERGKRYRYRLIGASCMTCSYRFSISGHNLTAISADGGNEFKPEAVKSIIVNSAERFDFVINANQTPGTYLISVRAVESYCRNLTQFALLHYRGSGNLNVFAPINPPAPEPPGVILNPPNSTCDDSKTTQTRNEICLDMLSGVENAPSIRGTNAPYYQSVIPLGDYLFALNDLFAPGTYQRYEEPTFDRLVVYTAQNISNTFPPSPLLTQYYDNPEEEFCSEECYSSNIRKSCQCTNVEYFPSNAILDLIIVDTEPRADSFTHPMHLHGFDFWVLDIGLLNQSLSLERRISQLQTTAARDGFDLRQAVMKDTISVTSGGHAVVRVYTDNPGYWLFHCHFVFHLENGMSLIYQIGDDSEMLKPSRNFPRCGNYYGN